MFFFFFSIDRHSVWVPACTLAPEKRGRVCRKRIWACQVDTSSFPVAVLYLQAGTSPRDQVTLSSPGPRCNIYEWPWLCLTCRSHYDGSLAALHTHTHTHTHTHCETCGQRFEASIYLSSDVEAKGFRFFFFFKKKRQGVRWWDERVENTTVDWRTARCLSTRSPGCKYTGIKWTEQKMLCHQDSCTRKSFKAPSSN